MSLTPEEEQELRELEELEELEALERAALAARPQAAPQKEKEGWYEDFGEGLAVSGMETYYGLKDLVGQMDDEDKARLEDWRQDANESGWGKAGQVVGDIGQTIVPGGAGLKVLKGAGMIKNMTRAKRFGADVLASGALGAAQAPEEDETRTDAALQGAGGAVLGGALAKTVGKAMNGIGTTTAAKRLMKEGVELTPGQASANPIWRGLETAMTTLPTTSKGVKLLRDRALGQYNNRAINHARAPGAEEISGVGYGAQRKLKQGFEKAYREAWAKAEPPSAQSVNTLLTDMQRLGGRLNKDSKQVLKEFGRDIKDLHKKYTPEKLRQLDNDLRVAKNAANNPNNPNPHLSRALEKTRERVRDMVSPEVRQDLAKVDKQYRRFKTVEDAGLDIDADSSAFGAAGLRKSSIKNAKSKGGARGEGPMQRYADLGVATLGRKDPPPMVDLQKAIARHMMSPTPILDFGGRVLLGKTSGQKVAQGVANKINSATSRAVGATPLANVLRNMDPTTAALMGAYMQERE